MTKGRRAEWRMPSVSWCCFHLPFNPERLELKISDIKANRMAALACNNQNVFYPSAFYLVHLSNIAFYYIGRPLGRAALDYGPKRLFCQAR